MTETALTVEYQELGQNMRVYVVQRYTQLSPFVALMTGLGALEYASALQITAVGKVFTAFTGFLVSGIFLILDRRSHWYWNRLYERSKVVEDALKLRQFTSIPAARGPFTATNGVLIFYVFMAALWLFALALSIAALARWQLGDGWTIVVGAMAGVAALGLAMLALKAPGLRPGR